MTAFIAASVVRFFESTIREWTALAAFMPIVAGMGGENLRGFGGHANRNSVYRVEGHAGVLLLTLGAAEYRSAFLDGQGRVWDPSGGKCH